MDEQLKKKKDEEARQIWVSIAPKAEQCKKCRYAAKDTEFMVGAEMAFCEIYPMPDGKPAGVLDDKTECYFFTEK